MDGGGTGSRSRRFPSHNAITWSNSRCALFIVSGKVAVWEAGQSPLVRITRSAEVADVLTVRSLL